MKHTDEGQLYTIEGFAAALIMVITAFLVVNATSVYTAGDTHINDMQLEALGSDALTVMGTPINNTMDSSSSSDLRTIIESDLSQQSNREKFNATFFNLINSGNLQESDRFIQYTANFICRNQSDNLIQSYPISYSRNFTGEEHSVKATKWVIINKGGTSVCGTNNENRAVLVEVLLWRD
jgi:hypothetical protein